MKINSSKNHQCQAILHFDLSNLPLDQSQTSMLISLAALGKRRYGFHISFDIKGYPLRQHFCYMQQKNSIQLDDLSELRFSEMNFEREPHGLIVGPWPGWRGIPHMPKVTIESDQRVFEARYNFWGDELETGTVRLYVLVSIPNSKLVNVRLDWADARMAPVSLSIYPSNKIRPEPMPVQLRPELQYKHPRLLFGSSDLVSLMKKKVHSCQDVWNEIVTLLKNWVMPFEITLESKLLSGAERLHEFDRAILASFYTHLTNDTLSLQRAKEAFESLLESALSPNYEPMATDTQSGECLFTLSVAFDWLVQFLSNNERRLYQEKLFCIADRVWQHLDDEREDYGQAHFLGCSHGLLAFSFLFWDQHPQAQEWASYLRGVFEYVLKMLPDDGFYPHGINLWIYEHAFLLRFLELFRHCADLNYWSSTPYWKNASLFRKASLSPDKKYGITFGDPQYRVAGDAWMHYLIASRTKNPEAQNLGKQLSRISVDGVDFRNMPARRRVWEFLYFDPQISPQNIQRKSCYFEDGGQIFWRQSLRSKEILTVFKSGYILGKQRYDWGEWSGYGHSDPCNGSFLIAKGDSFLLCGSGPVYRRDTALHNTLTFDNYGQIGDGMVWAPEFIPEDRFPAFHRMKDKNMDSVVTDLTHCFLDFIGVRKAVRRFMVFNHGVILIQDSIQLNVDREIQWNLHTYGNIVEETIDNMWKFYFSDGSEQANILILLPENIQWRTGLTAFVPAYPNSGNRDRYFQLFKQGIACEFLVLILLENVQIKYNLDFLEKNDRLWQLKLSIEREEFIIDSNP